VAVPVLGEFEQLVLLALLRLGPDTYSAAVSLEIEAQTGRSVSVSAVHTTLDRLEDKGFIRSRLGEPTPQRGGKRKRHYEVVPAGVRALRFALRGLRRMTAGLDDLLGGAV
jgi:PadR family transcriptional regulator, regulatory protein PadR